MRRRVLLIPAAGVGLAMLVTDTDPWLDRSCLGTAPVPTAPARRPAPDPELHNPLSEEVLARLCPPGAPDEQVEATVLARLRQPDVSEDEFAILLRLLGRSTASPEAIGELVRQMEYDEVMMRYFRADKERWGVLDSERPKPKRDNPAVVALLRVGVVAAPRLVDEYVYFFENTDPEAWDRVGACIRPCDQNGNVDLARSADHRCSLILVILADRPEVAQRAVEYASQWMRGRPDNDYIRRACKTLIRDILAHYPESDRPKLFPGVASPE